MREACSTWNMALPSRFHLAALPTARRPNSLLADMQPARFTAMSGQYPSIKRFPKGQKVAIRASLLPSFQVWPRFVAGQIDGASVMKRPQGRGCEGRQRQFSPLSAGHESPWGETQDDIGVMVRNPVTKGCLESDRISTAGAEHGLMAAAIAVPAARAKRDVP